MSQEITQFTILGERNSGTNWLESLMVSNFNIPVTWDFGWKHFFGMVDYLQLLSESTLFIGIVRDPVQWLGAMKKRPYHIPEKNKKSWEDFLLNEFWSETEDGEVLADRNLVTNKRYKDIFQLRSTKSIFLLEQMPKLVKNYILIKYEDLFNNPRESLNLIGKFLNKSVGQIIKKYDPDRKLSTYILPDSAYEIVTKYIDHKLEKQLGYEVTNSKSN